MQTPMPPDAAKEIEHVKSMVARHFPVYDVKVSYDVVEFYCRIDEAMLEESFDKLREEMAQQGYIPMVTYQKGEHIIIVGKKPKARYRSIYVNLAMFIITLVAMTFAGIGLWSEYADVPSSEVYTLRNIGTSILVFTLPLLAILGIHELGHFFMARRRKVAASLPFFIPSIPPLGTLGAVISLRDPIPDRKSLLEIGIAGPIAGLLMAIPIGLLGLVLTNADARPIPDSFETGSIVYVAFPLIYEWMEMFVPIAGDFFIHPLVFAAWAGFLVTAINLLPVGQLDGGHIARAILGQNAKYASWVMIAGLIVLSFFWLGWIFLALLVLFFGAKHPPPLNDITKLDTKRKAAGLVAFVILFVTFMPIPITILVPDHSVEMSPADAVSASIAPGGSAEFSFWVENAGNVKNNITVFAESPPTTWTIEFKPNASDDQAYASTADRRFDISENATFNMRVTCGPSAPGEQQLTVIARSESSQEADPVEDRVVYTFDVEYPELEFWAVDDAITVLAGDNATAVIQVNNTGYGDVALTFTTYDLPASTSVDLYEDEFDENSTYRLNLTVPASSSATFTVLVSVADYAIPGERMISIQATYFDVVLEMIEIGLTVS
ncbi:MAG: site-2 protease family protein [Thermoplasmata archaeon]|nr:site-2 protease family protein [Thermoplasmata archaeon]